MKYLYVLTSDDTDYYLEQALMSVTSLKIRMPDGFVSLLIDDATEKTLAGKRAAIRGLVDEIKTVEIDRRFDKTKRSRWLKTSMRNLIEGDFLYIDCDTVICDTLDGIERLDSALGAALDKHCLLDAHHMKETIQRNDKKAGFSASFESSQHFNSGVLWCGDVPACHAFFEEWHRLWLGGVAKGVVADQPSLNMANVNRCGLITELDRSWNCQITYGGLRYLMDSKIIHYFASNLEGKPYLLSNNSTFKEIKNVGGVTEEIKNELLNQKICFLPNCRIIADTKMLMVIDSATFTVLKKIFNTAPMKIVEKILQGILNIKRRYRNG